MGWIKKNWVSLFAAMVAIIAIIRVEPFIIKEDTIQWGIPICISILTIAVTVALGGQILSAMTIEKRINDAVDKAKNDVREEITTEMDKDKRYSLAVYAVILARMSQAQKDFDDAFVCYIHAINTCLSISFNDLIGQCLTELEGLMWLAQKGEITIIPSDKEKEELIRTLAKVEDERSFELIKFISSIK